MMHKLLERQLRKAAQANGGKTPDLESLLALVDQTYCDHDRERRLSNQAATLMEEELRQANHEAKLVAERHLQAILDTAGEGVVIADRQGRIIDVNRALLTIFGYDRQELIGQSIAILTTSADTPDHDGHMERYNRTGEAKRIGSSREETARRKNGEEFPIELAVGDLASAGVPQFVGIVRDISERKKAQEQVSRSEQMFRDFAQSTSDWFWETDSDHRFVRFTGYSPTLDSLLEQGLVGKSRLELMAQSATPADLIERHKATLDAHLPFRDFTYYTLVGDTKKRFLNVSGKPLFDAKGTFLGYRGSASDVTEQEAARERLSAVEAQLLAAISSISEGFVLYDSANRLVVSNERYGALFPQNIGFAAPGTSFEEVIREGLRRNVYALGSDGPQAWLERRLTHHRNAEGQPFLQEMADGRWIRSTEYPTRDGGVVGIHSDITQAVGLEQALRNAKEQAEAANRAKSEFLATMSHEIRTPMNGIIGMTGLLLDTPMNDEQRYFANTVRVSAEALLSIINDILDISKMEAGKIEFEENAFDLPTLLEGVVDILSPRVKARDIDLTCFVAPEASGYYVGDAGRLRQVLLNLAGNAVKFTEHGSVSIQCQCLSEAGDKRSLRFSINDTGIGIPEWAKPQLFAMFSQADSSTRRRFGGTGLGLAISKRIVELMGGGIGFESHEGKGSQFWFDIPLTRSPDHAVPQALPSLLGLRILVVDDIAVNRDVFRRQLEMVGGSVEDVDSAPAGLMRIRSAMAEGKPFDLVLLDHQLPGMSGLDLAAILRADPQMSGLKLVMATSAHLTDVKDQAKRIGIDVIMAKPVQQSRLVECLQTISGRLDNAASEQQSLPMEEAAPALPLRILVAEDNAINQQVAVGLLARLGHRADVANDGAEAVEMIQRGDYDLILMDMQMPVMDGIAATEAIRSLEGDVALIPIIAMTANAMQSDRERCLDAGMDDYVPKPIDRRRLGSLLNRWAERLARKRSHCEPRAQEAAASEPAPKVQLPLIDQETYDELLESLGKEAVRSLLNSFRKSAPSQMAGVLTALKDDSPQEAARIVHSLRGAASNLGFMRLDVCLKQLEPACKDNSEQAVPLAEEAIELLKASLAEIT
jgi:PAS domain S-box-containing protein